VVVAVGVAVVAATSLAGCGVQAGARFAGGSTTTPTTLDDHGGKVLGVPQATTTTTAPTTTLPPPPDVVIRGDDGSATNDLVANVVTDLQTWWATVYPDAFGGRYRPLRGGLYAIDPGTDPGSIPCLQGLDDIHVVLDNAFYCPDGDAVIWDQSGFLDHLAHDYGDLTVDVVIAHEWGHVIQDRAGLTAPSVISELQADCFAGAWAHHARVDASSRVPVDPDQLDQALAGMLSLRDAPGGEATDPTAHGSGFDRVGAFQDGYESGVDRCKVYRSGDPKPYQFPFTSSQDQANEGDMALSGTTDDPGIVQLAFPSLDAYWADTYPTISGGKRWTAMGDPVGFDPDHPPSCDGRPVEGYGLFVCLPDRYIGYDDEGLIPDTYDQDGDFAVATLFATQYGLAVESRLDHSAPQGTQILRADCYAGAWAAAILPPEPPERYQLVLSPGDLDEAVEVLLSSRSASERRRLGPGFDRVRAFRVGVLRGADACSSVTPS
jgi:predicted metalloprotease